MLDFLLTKSLNLIIDLKYIGLFLVTLGFPVPIEMVLGILGSKGYNILHIALVSGFGSVLGFQFPYLLGYIFTIRNPDNWLGSKTKFFNFDKVKIEKSRNKIIKHGFIYIVITRFLPWLRVATSMAAGFLRVNIFIHSLGVFIGMFTYSIVVAYIGANVAQDTNKLLDFFRTSDKFILILTLLSIAIYLGFRFRQHIAKLIIKRFKK